MAANKKRYYYTYWLFLRDGRNYIGVRTTSKVKPSKDDYFGSSKYVSKDDVKLKVVLREFKTKNEALQDEIELHEKYGVAANPHFANRSKLTSTGFSIAGGTGEGTPMYGKQHTEKIDFSYFLVTEKLTKNAIRDIKIRT